MTDSSNYEQLGLDFRLYSAEVLFNCGLTKVYLGHMAAGMADMRQAQTQKQVAEHGVIDDAIRDQGRDYTVFSVPVSLASGKRLPLEDICESSCPDCSLSGPALKIRLAYCSSPRQSS